MLKLKFWERSATKTGPRELPDDIRAMLVETHGMDPIYARTLRYMEKDGKVLNKRSRLVRIYDPALVRAGGPALVHYDNLVNYRYAVIFAGHVSGDDIVLTDQRWKKREPTKPGK